MPSYTPANSATLSYTIVFPSGVDTRNLTIERKSQESVIVEVSKMDEITVSVGGNFLGQVSEEYRKDTPIFDPAVITVRGPKKYLVNVDHAYVEYGEAGKVYSGTFTDGNARVVLMDSSNKPCENTEFLSLSADTVSVTLPVLAQKTVPIAITPQWGSGATVENTHITYEPETLKLAGDSAVLDEINQIQLDIVDMSSFGTSTTLKYTIRLPNGIRNISGITEATVTIEIQGVETKMFEVDQFVWTGVRDDVEVVVETEKLPVLLRGPSKFPEQSQPRQYSRGGGSVGSDGHHGQPYRGGQGLRSRQYQDRARQDRRRAYLHRLYPVEAERGEFMTQDAVVIKLLPNDMAEVAVTRGTACGGNCGSCESCMFQSELRVEARNLIQAKPGQKVTISSKSSRIFGAAFLVYVMPLLFFLLGYALAAPFRGREGIRILVSFAALWSAPWCWY